MDKVKMGFICFLGLVIFGGFGHEIYYATKAAGDPGPLVRKSIEGWCSSPYTLGLIGLAVGYLIGHSGGK